MNKKDYIKPEMLAMELKSSPMLQMGSPTPIPSTKPSAHGLQDDLIMPDDPEDEDDYVEEGW